MTAYQDMPQAAAAAPAAAAEPATAAAAVAGLPCANPSASYWLQTPSPVLLGHRTTPDLPAAADVVVIGSGITGAFAADRLIGRTGSGSVLLLEAREACSGATGRNGGHCQPMVYDAAAADVAAFELATFQFLGRFVADHNIDCDWRALPGGGVHAFLDQAMFDTAAAAVEALGRTRPDLAEMVTVVRGGDDAALADLRLRQPGVVGALVQRHAASVWPYKLVAWVLERLVQTQPASKFNLQTNTPATRLQKSADGGWLVTTPRGTTKTKAVLLATNGYTTHLLPPALADLIVPVRGQVAALVPPGPISDADSPQLQLTSSYVFLGHDPDVADGRRERDEYLVQRPVVPNGGHLIFGGGRERASNDGVGVWRDDEVEPGVAEFLRSHLAPVLDVGGGTANAKDDNPPPLAADYEWTGIMGYSRDHCPWVGRVPAEMLGMPAADTSSPSGLYIAAGFTGHGMPSTSLCGRAVARMIRKDLGWDAANDTEAEDNDGDHPLPASHILTTERLARVRATCSPVSVSDKRGSLADFQELLQARLAAK